MEIKVLGGFFEELDEAVYISDVETHELLYMNRLLREQLGLRSHKEYVGKMCYALLQGADTPCSFCTNASLEEGKFLAWTHKNPVLNKRYLIKDSLFLAGGRKCRIEIAVDADSGGDGSPYYFVRSESILNECLQQVFSSVDPEESIRRLLAYIGKTFHCGRAYVFEFEGSAVNNTYEWCERGIVPQKEILQAVPPSSMDWWIQHFQKNEVVVISDLEEVRTAHPTTYAVLKPQEISRLVVGPIISEDEVVGFLGVDDPSAEALALVGPLIKVVGYFITSLLKRRDLLRRLNTLSFRDSLTGAFNRTAMFEHSSQLLETGTVGVVYCDITGLKQTNDSLGHGAGDRLICHCHRLIQNALETPWLYRTGGDEFVAIFRDVEEETFRERVSRLRKAIQKDKHHVAVGCAWSCQPPFYLEQMISQADRVMYEDKRDYYSANRRTPGVERRRGRERREKPGSLFEHFLNTTYHDMESLFRSISQQSSTGYYYFGDMQKDLFFISDNMRDEFGFQSNVVPGLLQAWAQRIPSARAKEMYFREIQSMLEEKRTIHDLRYQVRDVTGRSMWIRCYGVLKWDESMTKPLFFSGRITHQDNEFVIDPVTNFPREPALFRRLDEARTSGRPALVVGFSFNNIAEINSTRGRAYSDHLIKSIADELMERLSDKVSFYRLEGMRCVAVADAGDAGCKQELTGRIAAIISDGYHIMGISVQHACSFALMEYPQPRLMPSDLLEQMVSLIRIAKHDTSQMFVEYSQSNVEKIKNLSNMALALSRDVLHGMEHFRIVVQPTVSVAAGGVTGGEVLLRWEFEGEEVPPSVFIPMLERENMIHLAGRWVFEQTVCTCMRLTAYDPDFCLAFNVSLQQIADTQFPDFMREVLSKYQVQGSRLVAEMTESCMDEQPEKLIRFVEVCGDMGIRLALDDFGSGYSSLRMLLQYPTSIIKLDRSLLGEMSQSADKMNFISSIVYACHRFGKKVCMEGVETAEQDGLIKESGCDMIQGYHYYRPMEVDDLYRLLANKNKRPARLN